MKIHERFDKILVTGPQRSGTRIMAKIIAHDNGIRYVDENELEIRDIVHLGILLRQDEKMVIQCPALCYCIHDLPYIFDFPDLLIIMVIRDVVDIICSQNNIRWREWANKTWKKYEKRELQRYGRKDGIVSEIKYEYWEKQKNSIPNWLEVKYDDLKDHPLFIPKEKRKDFKYDQTELEIAT